jgi:hypothetical protein
MGHMASWCNDDQELHAMKGEINPVKICIYINLVMEEGYSGLTEFQSMNPSYFETGGLVLPLFFDTYQDRCQQEAKRLMQGMEALAGENEGRATA